jgi:zinc protease
LLAIDWNAAQLPTVTERLANGLNVIVHPEPKAPIAAVYVGYRAGSRDEPAGKAGLAHLCEHLMFSGTRNYPGSFFAPFEQAGAAWMNAFVKEDFSAYFATVPADALDFALAMEADRMVNLADALSEERLERQREVVINEVRQREGQPYGCANRILAELAHPPGHPYAHPPDGLISELYDISIDDVRLWLTSRHSPAMATLIIAGDVEPARAVENARRHFAPLLRQPGTSAYFPVANDCPEQRREQAAKLGHLELDSQFYGRRTVGLPVKNAKLCIEWKGPDFTSPEYPALEVACEILAGSRDSRLAHRLVYAEHLATDVVVEVRPRDWGARVLLSITAETAVPLTLIESLVRQEIERLGTDGPGLRELEVAQVRIFGKVLRGFERVGGPGSKSGALGLAAMIGASVDSHRRWLSALAAMRPEAAATASRWLSGAGGILEIYPGTEGNGPS